MWKPSRPRTGSQAREAERRFAPLVEELENRVLPSANVLPFLHSAHYPAPEALAALSTGTSSGTAAAALPPSASYSSLPGAPANIYLDFTGDTEAQWGSYSNIVTPAYDQDGDPSTFSSGELNSIYQIWAQVAEIYSPFNINVTTVAPSSLAHGVTQKVVIGGNSSWTGATYGGLTYTGSFANASLPNVSFDFSANLNNGNPWDTAQVAAHEAGHGFGLQHQSTWSGTTLTAEYSAGPGDGTAPIMGDSYSTTRGLWWYGTNDQGSTVYQNDMAVIASATNGFGYRPDAAGNSLATAAPLAVSGSSVSGAGVIESNTAQDFWSFTTDPGTITLTVSGPAGVISGNLHPKIELLDAQGNVVVAWQDPDSGQPITISATVTAGSYRLVVASHGPSAGSTSTSYGFDVGQYSISGTIVPPTIVVAAPSGLTATAVSAGQINLQWTDTATNATGYTVQRSPDGANWSVIANLGATATGFADTGLSAGTTYYYRVQASDGGIVSAYSNVASATTLFLAPAAPSNLTASVVKKQTVKLAWTDNASNETGYCVQRSTDGVSWTTIATLAANSTSYSTSLPKSGTYYFRVLAYNGAGNSTPSNVVSVSSSGLVSGAPAHTEALSPYAGVSADLLHAVASVARTDEDDPWDLFFRQ